MVNIKRQIDTDDHYNYNLIKYIVMHATGNYTDSDEANAKYFCSGYRGVSAHYFIDDDSITQVVEDFHGAYHCGDGGGKYGITNKNSLGIEMCQVQGQITDITMSNAIDLVKAKMTEYNVSIENVVRHYDASHKTCPEPWSSNNWAKWYEFKERLQRAITGTWKEGWNQNSTGWWYSTNPVDKTYFKDCWKLIEGKWYSFDSDGYARCNTWIRDKGYWYFLKSNGSMARNEWIWWKDECYYLGDKGGMYVNCITPDNYRVDEYGAWIH